MTAVNSIVPALMAGNAVILKHAAQTPLCAERMVEAFGEAGLPEGVFQYLHLTHESAARVIRSPQIAYVALTGAVAAGSKIEQVAAGRFIGVGLELGGKDPAYVRADADLAYAIEGLADGAFFNSGQSCCGIERIYAHSGVYDCFVDGMVEVARGYRLGNPLEQSTNLGPVVKASAAEFIRGQVDEAVRQGARALIDPQWFPENRGCTLSRVGYESLTRPKSFHLKTEV